MGIDADISDTELFGTETMVIEPVLGPKTVKSTKNKSLRASRIYLVEDHLTFREGLTQILNSEKDLVVCGQAGTADVALKEILRVKPDLVLVDITLPGKSGLEVIRELRKKNLQVKLLVLSMHDEALFANRVLRAGGDGYIMKQEDPEEIIYAIRDVLAGHIYVSESVLAAEPKASRKAESRRPTRPFDRLTDTELELLGLLGQGNSESEIARQLRLSPKEVAEQCAQVMGKLKLEGKDSLIRYAVRWVETGAT